MTASVVVEMVYQTTANRKKKKKEKRSKQKKEKEITPMRSAIQKASLKAENTMQGRKQVQSYISFINCSYLPWILLPFHGGNTSAAFVFRKKIESYLH